HCHPALIQLICAEIITLKNKQQINARRFATVNDVEEAIPGALQQGRFFFADIANNQVTPQGLALLHLIAAQGEGHMVSAERLRTECPDDFEATLDKLLQRELIELLSTGYCFQVELIRQWFQRY
ncbi:MAG: hypothetical protein KAH77_10415, partial [Thiomargarita sp.]|nr:hypothetical protein [Thiomargarita sp.]